MKVTARITMTKADLDSLTEADLRWLEMEISRRLTSILKPGQPWRSPAEREGSEP